MKHYCTLFGSNYVYKGLALHQSMMRHCGNFTLYVLCMDPITYGLLRSLRLPKTVLVSLTEFEDEQLTKAKETRSFGEYCWTCTPSLMLYLLKKYPTIERIIYLDADLYFFNSPQTIFRACAKKSVMIIPHRHAPQYQHLASRHGRYNVGMLIFSNDTASLTVLRYWRKKCLAWCFARSENGKYGDQGYLNDFPQLLGPALCILDHVGTDLAPWNIPNYRLHQIRKRIYVDGFPLIVYHFAGVQIYAENQFRPLLPKTLFHLTRYSRRLIYQPYFQELGKIIRDVRRMAPHFNGGYDERPPKFATVILLASRVKSFLKRIPWLHAGYTSWKKYRLGQSHLSQNFSSFFAIRALTYLMVRFVPGPRLYNAFLRLGYNLLKQDYYSPIPGPKELSFVRQSRLPGIRFVPQRYLSFLQSVVEPHKAELDSLTLFPTRNEQEFSILNGSFMSIDCHVYYAIIRKYKPRTIIEIGSGYSTLLASIAINKNYREARAVNKTTLICVDPFPKFFIKSGPGKNKTYRLVEDYVQSYPASFFHQLKTGDILFIDSSHVLKPGGDVWYLYDEVLPLLRPGVLVHIHDIELPYPYPTVYTDRQWFFTEQYLVQAFLAFNRHYQIIWPSSYMMTKFPQLLRKQFPTYQTEKHLYSYAWPSSLWLKVTG